MEIFLIRHGETDWNREGRWQGRENISLNAAGKAQARLLGEALRTVPFAAIYTSPLARARETAEAVGRYHDCPLFDDPGLIERSFGKLSGLLPEERAAFEKTGAPAGVEPWEALAKRTLSAALRIAALHPAGERAAVVTHGAWINALLATLSGGKIGSGKTLLKNTSVSILRGDGAGLVIVQYNLTGEEAAREAEE